MDYLELIAALRERRADAMECFQTAFTPLLRYVITPILPDERDQEECLSDIQFQVWAAIQDFDPDRASLSTWLTHLARSAALNRRRTNARRREDIGLDETLADTGGTPEQAAIQAETAAALWNAVKRLRPRDRELFLRKYYYYQSTAQVAAELGLTVRLLYRSARQMPPDLAAQEPPKPWKTPMKRIS